MNERKQQKQQQQHQKNRQCSLYPGPSVRAPATFTELRSGCISRSWSVLVFLVCLGNVWFCANCQVNTCNETSWCVFCWSAEREASSPMANPLYMPFCRAHYIIHIYIIRFFECCCLLQLRASFLGRSNYVIWQARVLFRAQWFEHISFCSTDFALCMVCYEYGWMELEMKDDERQSVWRVF